MNGAAPIFHTVKHCSFEKAMSNALSHIMQPDTRPLPPKTTNPSTMAADFMGLIHSVIAGSQSQGSIKTMF